MRANGIEYSRMELMPPEIQTQIELVIGAQLRLLVRISNPMGKRKLIDSWERSEGRNPASLADPPVATATKGSSTLIKKRARNPNLEINVEEPVPATESSGGEDPLPDEEESDTLS
jgi:hypothetical protein